MNGSRALRVLLPAITVAAAVGFLFAVRGVMLPFILSLLLAHSANPLLRRIERQGIKRDAAILLLYGAVALAAGAAALFVGPVAKGQLQEWTTHRAEYTESLRKVQISGYPAGEKAVDWFEEHKMSLAGETAAMAPELAGHFVEISLYFFLVPFISFFVMAAAPSLLQTGLELCPSRQVERLLNLIWALDETIGRYLRGVIMEASMVGFLVLVGLWAIGLKFAVWLGLLAGAANFIPYLGLVIGLVPAVVIALLQFGDPSGIGKVLAVYAAAKLADDFVFQPLIMQRAVHIHPVIVLFALSCGAELGGLLGLIFAVPVACIVRLFLATGWEWYRTEFGETASVAEPDLSGEPPILT